MPQITIKDLKHYLSQRSQQELVGEIVELFKRLDGVKDYYAVRLYGGYDEELLEEYKERVKDEFFPDRGFGEGRISIARRAVTDYKKVSSSAEALADLMVFYVEMGVRYTNSYGDIDAPFYSSMESMYERACKLIVSKKLQDRFEPRCKQIVRNTSEIGWGFHDTLREIYEEYFAEYV